MTLSKSEHDNLAKSEHDNLAKSEHGKLAQFPVADERRATLHAMNAWMAVESDDGGVPDLAILFDGSRRIRDNEFLIKVDDDTLDSVFIVCGDKISLPLGKRSIGKSVVRATEPALRDMFRDACAEAVRHGAMVYREGTAATAADTTVSYRCNFMPVRSGEGVSNMYVFGAYGARADHAMDRAAA